MPPGRGIRAQHQLRAMHAGDLDMLTEGAVKNPLEQPIQGHSALVFIHQLGEYAAFLVDKLSDMFWAVFQNRCPAGGRSQYGQPRPQPPVKEDVWWS